jgi:hypothetical protein
MSAPTISVIHATRGRYKLMWDAYRKAINKASNPDAIEWIFAMDEDDTTRELVYLDINSGIPAMSKICMVVGPKGQGNNGAWNLAYMATNEQSKVIVQMSDDFEPPDKWDELIQERLTRVGSLDEQMVLGVADPHFTPVYSGDGLMTIFIATRAYIDRCGYLGILYPEYPSLFSDNDLTDKAALDGVLVDGYDIPFLHHWHGAPSDPKRDDTYSRHATTWHNHEGIKVWEARKWMCFPDVDWLPEGEEDTRKPVEMGFSPPDGPYLELYRHRVDRGFKHLLNRPFPQGSWKEAWIRGDYKTAREGVEHLLNRYHCAACGGRFMMHGGQFIWVKCTEKIGDKDTTKSVREKFWL